MAATEPQASNRRGAFVVPAHAGTHTPRSRLGTRRLHQQIAEIAPLEIVLLDQLNLPIPLPTLQLFLPADRFVRTLIGFDIGDERRRF
jgi:hypothetical protein